jgi:hypothetical protein
LFDIVYVHERLAHDNPVERVARVGKKADAHQLIDFRRHALGGCRPEAFAIVGKEHTECSAAECVRLLQDRVEHGSEIGR